MLRRRGRILLHEGETDRTCAASPSPRRGHLRPTNDTSDRHRAHRRGRVDRPHDAQVPGHRDHPGLHSPSLPLHLIIPISPTHPRVAFVIDVLLLRRQDVRNACAASFTTAQRTTISGAPSGRDDKSLHILNERLVNSPGEEQRNKDSTTRTAQQSQIDTRGHRWPRRVSSPSLSRQHPPPDAQSPGPACATGQAVPPQHTEYQGYQSSRHTHAS